MTDEEVYKSMLNLNAETLNRHQEPPDTSRDGVSVLEAEAGSCIQVISNGITMLCSFDFYEKLIKSKKSLK